MITQSIDATKRFNAEANPTWDLGAFDFVIAQIVNPSAGTISFFGGIGDTGNSTLFGAGDAEDAVNLYTLMGTNLATQTGVTSVTAAAAVRFERFGRFFRFGKASITADAVYLHCIKIS